MTWVVACKCFGILVGARGEGCEIAGIAGDRKSKEPSTTKGREGDPRTLRQSRPDRWNIRQSLPIHAKTARGRGPVGMPWDYLAQTYANLGWVWEGGGWNKIGWSVNQVIARDRKGKTNFSRRRRGEQPKIGKA